MKHWLTVTAAVFVPILALSIWFVAAVDAQDADTTSTEPTASGAELFVSKTCTTCHGLDGKTPSMRNYPQIAGQNKEYALQQMKDIKSGTRTNGQAAAMKAVMYTVSDEEIEILAEYISSLER